MKFKLTLLVTGLVLGMSTAKAGEDERQELEQSINSAMSNSGIVDTVENRLAVKIQFINAQIKAGHLTLVQAKEHFLLTDAEYSALSAALATEGDALKAASNGGGIDPRGN